MTSSDHSPAVAEHDDFGIFEQNTEVDTAFEDFVIAPPPAISTPTPGANVSQDSLHTDDEPTAADNQIPSSGITAVAAEVEKPSVPPNPSLSYTGDHESHSMVHTERASPIKETSEDQSLVFDQSEGFDDFDDFDAFESAPPLEYTDTPDIAQPEQESRFDHSTPQLESGISVQPRSGDVVEPIIIATPHSEHEEALETTSDDFSAFETSLPPSIPVSHPGTAANGMTVASHTGSVAAEAFDSRTDNDSTNHAIEGEPHNEEADDDFGTLVQESEPSIQTPQPDHELQASFEPPVAAQRCPAVSLATNEAPVALETSTAYDDFSIFETSTNTPSANIPTPNKTAGTSLATHIHNATITPLKTHTEPQTQEDDDDFGAFEDAVSPLPSTPDTAWPFLAPPVIPALPSSWNIQNRYSIPLQAQTLSFAPLVPDLALPRPNTAPPLSLFPTPADQPVKNSEVLLLSTTTAPVRPSSAFDMQFSPMKTETAPEFAPLPRAQMPRSKVAITSDAQPTAQAKATKPNTTTPTTKLNATTTITTKPPTPAPKSKAPRTTPNPRHDAGNAILGVLAFLDAEDDAADEADNADDAFGAWSGESGMDGATEALASEKEVRRLRREEWVGERPGERKVEVGLGRGEVGAGKSVEEVDQDAVRRVVDGLPDWGYLL